MLCSLVALVKDKLFTKVHLPLKGMLLGTNYITVSSQLIFHPLESYLLI